MFHVTRALCDETMVDSVRDSIFFLLLSHQENKSKESLGLLLKCFID